jgi:lipoate-protein ligase A
MSPLFCHLLPYARADGTHNMAADEVLLETAATGYASLRFYGWMEATVSLGYFQPTRILQGDPQLSGLPYVRRSTGGETLVHHHEITYALAFPAGPPWQRRGESWTCRMHHVIAAALRSFGIPATLSGAEERQGNLLCFQHQTPGDVLIAGSKVVGSAQRKQRGGLLQHGGILLSQSPFTPRLPGIAELSGRSLSSEQVQAAVRVEFTRQTGWDLIDTDWTAAQQWRIQELVAEKYANPRWNDKR